MATPVLTAVLGCDAVDPAGPQDRIRLTAPDGEPENASLADGVPCAHLTLYIDRSKPAARAIEPGKRYRITIEAID